MTQNTTTQVQTVAAIIAAVVLIVVVVVIDIEKPKMKKVTAEQVHDFMKLHYKKDRFEGRNNSDWGKDYSMCIAANNANIINNGCYTCISNHDSQSGETVWFNHQLIELDSPPKKQHLPSNNLKDYLYGNYICFSCRNCQSEFVGPKHADYCFECIQEREW
uniref:hypothetical protein n=1 Tax=Pectobacterium carotovorum TaxID=554 RepID=UPI0015E82518|nr:hypothetical protein [Pectobacterium carotovorum]